MNRIRTRASLSRSRLALTSTRPRDDMMEPKLVPTGDLASQPLRPIDALLKERARRSEASAGPILGTLNRFG